MTALKKEAVQIIENLEEEDMIQVVAYLRNFNSSEFPNKDRNAAMEGLRVLQSFAGTLPADFDYKKELEEAREEKYGRIDRY